MSIGALITLLTQIVLRLQRQKNQDGGTTLTVNILIVILAIRIVYLVATTEVNTMVIKNRVGRTETSMKTTTTVTTITTTACLLEVLKIPTNVLHAQKPLPM